MGWWVINIFHLKTEELQNYYWGSRLELDSTGELNLMKCFTFDHIYCFLLLIKAFFIPNVFAVSPYKSVKNNWVNVLRSNTGDVVKGRQPIIALHYDSTQRIIGCARVSASCSSVLCDVDLLCIKAALTSRSHLWTWSHPWPASEATLTAHCLCCREKWCHMTEEEREDSSKIDENIAFGQLGWGRHICLMVWV